MQKRGLLAHDDMFLASLAIVWARFLDQWEGLHIQQRKAELMRDFDFQCVIDGENYTVSQLERVQYLRHILMLHQLKRLGADVAHGEKMLSHDDIDGLGPEEARAVSIATRQAFDIDGIKHLFRKQLLEADRLWKAANDAPDGAPLLLARTQITVRGISLEALGSVVNLDAIHQCYALLHPDHHFASGDSVRLEHMEIFGHYGGPTWLYAHPDQSLTVPGVERDPDYPMVMAGSTTLGSDGTPMNLFAYHQFKPLEHGFSIKQCAAFPPRTPQVIVDGHKVHLAIEILEATKLAAAR